MRLFFNFLLTGISWILLGPVLYAEEPGYWGGVPSVALAPLIAESLKNSPEAEAAGGGGVIGGTPPLAAMSSSMETGSIETVSATAITPEIEELAKGLQHDPLKIFLYCRNHIAYEHYYGSVKGATMTLLEGKGNSFDTSSLMVALLRASGYTAGYRFGLVSMTDSLLSEWLNIIPLSSTAQPFPGLTDSQFRTVFKLSSNVTVTRAMRFRYHRSFYFGARGYPINSVLHASDSSLHNFPHVTVVFTDAEDIVRNVDPSLKTLRTPSAKIDIATAANLSKSDMLTAAGGTVNSYYTSGMLEANLRNYLRDHTSTFLTWLADNKPNAGVDELIGVRQRKQYSFASLADIPNSANSYVTAFSWFPVDDWDEIPAMWTAALNVKIGQYDYTASTFTSTAFTDSVPLVSLNGEKLSLVFSDNTATLRRNENTWASVNVPAPADALDISLNVDHPHGIVDQSSTTGIIFFDHDDRNPTLPVGDRIPTIDQTDVKKYRNGTNHAAAIFYGFDPSGKMLRKRQEILDGYVKVDPSQTSWEVRTELLNIIGLTWLQNSQMNRHLVHGYKGSNGTCFHRFGRMVQEASYFIDADLQYTGDLSFDGNDFEPTMGSLGLSAHFDSALEHGVLEQFQGSGVSGVSTIKVLQEANAQGSRIYRATAANWSTVRSRLVSQGFPTASITLLETLKDEPGAMLLLPDVPNTTLGIWQDHAFAGVSSLRVRMIISDVYSGGYATQTGGINPVLLIDAYNSQTAYALTGSGLQFPAHDPITVQRYMGADPVDMATGAFTLNREDLSVGKDFPVGLSFKRNYDSNRHLDNSPGLGFGWDYNLNIRAVERSATSASLGGTTPAQAAPYLLALAAADQLYRNHTTPREWLAAALVAKWGVDQIGYNGVSINFGGRAIEFVRMPDGITYVPPAGITMSLEKVANKYVLKERHGRIFRFDALGRIEKIEDLHGNTATFHYIGDDLDYVEDEYGRTLTLGRTGGRITTITESAGTLSRGITFGYINGYLETADDPEDSTETYRYDGGRIDQITDGRYRVVVRNFYNGNGTVDRQWMHGDPAKESAFFYSGFCNIERNSHSDQTSYYYDGAGRCHAVEDPLGNRSHMGYDGQNHLNQIASPSRNGRNGNVFLPHYYYYDKNHNLYAVYAPKRSDDDPNPYYLRLNTYDSDLRLWFEGDFRGGDVTYTYTTKHQIYQVWDRKGQLIQTNAYNTDGTLLSVTDAADNITEYLNYDSYGYARTIKYPSVTVNEVPVRPTDEFVFDARGNLLDHTDRNGATTSTSYNERRQPRVTTLPAVDGVSHTTEIVYDSAGNPSQIRDAKGNWTTTEISQTGKTLSTSLPATAAGNAVISNHYDSRDWRDWSLDAAGKKTQFGNDAAGRLTSVIDPLGHTTYSSYNADGELQTITDPLSKITTTRYNWRGEVWQTENALTHTTTLALDANGNKDTLTNKRGKLFDFDYDYNDRLISLKTPLLKETTRDWNNRGMQDYIAEPSTDRAVFGYDNMSRLNQTIFKQAGVTVATVTRKLDKQGNLQKLTEEATGTGTKEVSFTEYDSRNRLRNYVDARNKTIGYRHDGNGNLTEIIYPDGRGSVLYTYDTLNRLETVTDWANRVTRYHYDINGRLKLVERPNGTKRGHAWDAAGQMRGVSEINSYGTPLYYAANRHDAAGRQDQEIVFPSLHPHTPPAFSAIYDDDNRLSTFNGTATVNDNDGNLTTGPLGASASTSFTYNTRNQLLSAGGLTYTYDPAGSRIGLTDAGGETKWTTDTNASLSRALVREKPGGQKTYYIYGLGLLYEINTVGTVTTTTTYHFDSRGSTTALTADNGSTILDRFEYDPYGKETWRQGSYDTPFRFNGAQGVHTDPNGLLHMRARYYNPIIRRFLNADPIGFSGGSNWFAYADGNPISLSDPFGLCAERNACTGGYGKGSAVNYNAGWSDVLSTVHYGLDGVGLIPGPGEFADGAGALLYLAEGNYTDATIGFAAMIPFAGWAATSGKVLRYGDEAVNLASSQRTTHILTGDATGGGHLFPGGAGKSSFPQNWSGDRVMHEISDVATDPLSLVVPGRGGRSVVTGTRDGIDMTVILESQKKGGEIITGFPTNVPRNP